MQIPKWPVWGDRETDFLRLVLESERWGGYHEVVARFERTFAAFQHCGFGVAAANGTVTLEMALEAAGVGPGDEVIVPAISFISSATAISRVGATPVFVDIGSLTFNLDPERVAAAVSPRTRAILAVHFGGAMADMDSLLALAGSRGIALIEDAAHAHGSEWAGRRAGSLGMAGSFSFQNSKVMTAGEGGILLANDAEFAARVRSIGDQGRREGGGWFHHYTLGTNYRMTAWQAAILMAQLERLPEQICRRAANVALLRSATAGIPGLRWQEVPARANANSWYLMLGRIDAARFGITRDEFQRAMVAGGVPCTPFYPHTLYGNPLYKQGGCRVEPCPVAEETIRDAFWFPHRVLLAEEETVREVAGLIGRLARRG
ncbi:MAG TPA: DegT/DnrJ/EryC1/StrS family aminotransferase [Bryobacteraceae bacterium]|nr:DegT/DnrJ/EryC1/StrS family aminotransferase [Bryobacteraceae bacterium]